MKPITFVRVKPAGAHAEVWVWVNHALAGSLVMRPEEAEEFRGGLERGDLADALDELERIGIQDIQLSKALHTWHCDSLWTAELHGAGPTRAEAVRDLIQQCADRGVGEVRS
jgi:hypothetical protein